MGNIVHRRARTVPMLPIYVYVHLVAWLTAGGAKYLPTFWSHSPKVSVVASVSAQKTCSILYRSTPQKDIGTDAGLYDLHSNGLVMSSSRDCSCKGS